MNRSSNHRPQLYYWQNGAKPESSSPRFGGFRRATGISCADVPQEHPPPLNSLCNLSLRGV